MKPVRNCAIYAGFFIFLCSVHAQIQRVDPNAVRAAKPGLPAPKEQIALGKPEQTGTMTVENAISQQKNTRRFLPDELEPAELTQLAWAGQSVTPAVADEQMVKYNIEPIGLYFCLRTGVYHYNSTAKTLDSIASIDVRGLIADATGNAALKEAPCIIVITGRSNPSSGISLQQMRNIMMLIAGKAQQNISLEAESQGLGTLGVIYFDMGKIKRIARLPAQQEALCIVAVGHPLQQIVEETPTSKSVLFIMPGSSRPEEIFNMIDLFHEAGLRTYIAQSGPTLVRTETTQRRIEPDLTMQNVNVADYDVIIPIGGGGNPGFLRSPVLLNIIRTAVRQGKIVGAAGENTAILANAGVVNGVRVTGDPISLNKTNAIYTGNLVESDRGTVTALNTGQTSLFARAILTALKGETTTVPPNPQAVPGPGRMLNQNAQ